MSVGALWSMHVAGSKADGYCGELDATGTRMCVEWVDHDGRHTWEAEEDSIRLHVLTACTRPSNLTVMGESLIDAMCEPWELCWHIRFNPEHDDLGGHRQKNEMLAQITDGWVLFLDDDTVMHPDLLKRVAEHPDAAGVVVNQDRTADLGHMLWAAPENMHLGGVDIGQVVLSRELIGDFKMPAGQGGDGVFLQACLQGRNDIVYLSETLSLYNALA